MSKVTTPILRLKIDGRTTAEFLLSKARREWQWIAWTILCWTQCFRRLMLRKTIIPTGKFRRSPLWSLAAARGNQRQTQKSVPRYINSKYKGTFRVQCNTNGDFEIRSPFPSIEFTQLHFYQMRMKLTKPNLDIQKVS